MPSDTKWIQCERVMQCLHVLLKYKLSNMIHLVKCLCLYSPIATTQLTSTWPSYRRPVTCIHGTELAITQRGIRLWPPDKLRCSSAGATLKVRGKRAVGQWPMGSHKHKHLTRCIILDNLYLSKTCRHCITRSHWIHFVSLGIYSKTGI